MDPLEEGRKQRVAALFHRASETYDDVGVDFFTPLAAELVARAGLRAGDAVLDLGTGRGAALRAIAEAVGPTGTALGLDLAPGMVERTRADLADLPQVRVELGDADHPPARDGGWDAVVASLVLFFLADPPATVRRIRETLRPGGTLALSSFAGGDQRWDVVPAAVAPFMVGDPIPMPGRSWFETGDSLAALLTDAGFVEVSSVEIEHRNVYADPEHWLAWSWSAGARAMWERVDPARLVEAQRAALSAVEGLVEPDGRLVEVFRPRFTTAHAP